jgi:hypothetical protein
MYHMSYSIIIVSLNRRIVVINIHRMILNIIETGSGHFKNNEEQQHM